MAYRPVLEASLYRRYSRIHAYSLMCVAHRKTEDRYFLYHYINVYTDTRLNLRHTLTQI